MAANEIDRASAVVEGDGALNVANVDIDQDRRVHGVVSPPHRSLSVSIRRAELFGDCNTTICHRFGAT
jgi:hypothetical protein